MGFFNRGMYFEFMYKQAKGLIGKDNDSALKIIDEVINETYGIPILVYHDISDKDNQYCVSAEEFEWQMNFLKENGFRFITYDMLKADAVDYREKNVLISFDDARLGALKHAKEVLKKNDIPIMMFIASSYQEKTSEGVYEDDISAFMTWDDLKEWMAEGGISIGAHSHSHLDMSTLTEEEIEKEIKTNNEIVFGKLGVACKDFAFPYGKYKKVFLPVYKRYFDTVSTLGSGLNYEGIDKAQLRRTAVLRMFSHKDFCKLVDFSETREKYAELIKGI